MKNVIFALHRAREAGEDVERGNKEADTKPTLITQLAEEAESRTGGHGILTGEGTTGLRSGKSCRTGDAGLDERLPKQSASGC